MRRSKFAIVVWHAILASLLAGLPRMGYAATGSATSGRVTVNTQGATLSGTLVVTVRDGTTDAVVTGATVIAGVVTNTTDASGRATISPATNGASLVISKSGYSALNTVCQVQGVGTYYQTERLAPYLGTTQKPIINSAVVRPFAFTVQATGLNIPVFIVPDVSWGPGSNGKLNYTTAVKSGSVNRGTPNTVVLLNPTSDLPTSGLPIPKTYSVILIAETSAGQSPPVSKDVVALAMPAWLYNSGAYYAGENAPTAGELSYIPFEIRRTFVDNDLNLGIVTINSKVAFVASGSLGGSLGQVSGFRGTYSFEGGPDVSIEVQGNHLAPGGIKPTGGIEGEGRVKIEGEWYPALVCNGFLDLKLRGYVGIFVPVRAIFLLDPTGAGTAFNTWVDTWPSMFRDYLDEFAYLDASLGASIQTITPIAMGDNGPYLDLQNGLYGLGTDMRIKGHVGTTVVYVEGTLGGGGTCWFSSTSEGATFDHAEYTIEGAVAIGFFQWERSFGVEYQMTVPDLPRPAAPSFKKSSSEDSGTMTLISRDYANRPGYGRFALDVQDVKARRLGGMDLARGGGGPLGPVQSSAFVQDVFPNTTAGLAGRATNDAVVLFSYDNTNLIQVQAMDIYATKFDGVSWSAPAVVASNTQTELHPQVAYDVSNRTVGVWMRMRDTNFTDSTNVLNYLSQFDIVASYRGVASNGWTTGQVISSSLCLNYDPRFSRAPSGALAAWWQSNPSNQLEGDVTSSNNAPSQWLWSRWDASQALFVGTAVIDTNVVGALSPNLIYGRTNAWLFWAQDQDRDYATSNDTALCYRYWNGSVWGTNIVLTSSGQVVTVVQAAMLTNGTPLAVWWQNGDLVYAKGPSFATVKTARANSGDLTAQRLNLVLSPDNKYVLLVFPLTTSNGANLAYRVYDTRADLWGGDFAFESTNTLDFSLAPTFVGAEMWSAYTRGIMAYSTKVVNVGATNIVLSNIPYRVRTDLMLAKYQLDADVSAVSVDVPASYPPVIQVTVANEGDTVVSNLMIEVREDSSVGPLVGSLTVPSLLAPHTMDTFVLPWTISSNSATRVLTAVLDPTNAISEFRESNNAITNRVLLTQIAIAGLAQERGENQTNIWIVQAENPLCRTISNVVANIRLDATNGTMLASTSTNLPAYETIEMRLPLDATGLTTNNIIVTELSAAPAAGETNATQVYLSSGWAPDDEQVPDMVSGLRFLRPGVSNSLPMGWTPPLSVHDGIRVVRATGTNEPEEIGFAEVPLTVFLDAQAGVLTQLSYRVAAYNGLAAGPLSAPIATNTSSPDGSGEGLPDDWQTQYFSSPSDTNAAWNADGDGDGFANWQEYLFGSNPTNSADYPAVEIRKGPSGKPEVVWEGVDGQSYRIEASDSATGWSSVAVSGVIATNGLNTVLDSGSSGGTNSQRYYRLKTP